MLRHLLRVGPLLALPACAPPPYPTSSNASGDPSIRITFPLSNDSGDTAEASDHYCSSFLLAVYIENFTLSKEHLGGAAVEGEGHWHLYDDDTYVGTSAEEFAFIPMVDEQPLSDGLHVIEVRLAGNDHQELSTALWDTEITIHDDDTCIGGGSAGGSDL